MICRYKSDCRGMSPSEIFDKILNDRNIENTIDFLYPKEKDMLPLGSMKNELIAAEKINDAVDNGYKIMILADTDTDGITSGAIMYRYLKYDLGADVYIDIDNGKVHGVVIDKIKEYIKYDMLIIVDSLNSDIEAYIKLRQNSNLKDVIVLDHHVISDDIPYDKYVTLVSSQRNYENKELSGSGVCWKMIKLLDDINDTNYADKYIDLAATGIIADMVSMASLENRYIVSKGLGKINNPAIKKIVGGFDFNSTAVSFSVAPLINASNRIDENKDALNAFLVDENKDVLKYIKTMKKCKERQNEEVSSILDDIETQCDEQINNKMIVVFIETDYGVAGLIGNKLLDKYKRPILVLHDHGDIYAGSMRAVGVNDFRSILNDSGLAKAMGHELAAGVEINKDDLASLIDYMEVHLPDTDKEIYIDADIRLNINDITKELIDKIKLIDKISGTDFKQVRVFIDGITSYSVGNMSDHKHIVITTNDSNATIIKWNWNGDWDNMYDSELMNDEIKLVATLDSGYIGRTFMLKVVCDEIEVG